MENTTTILFPTGPPTIPQASFLDETPVEESKKKAPKKVLDVKERLMKVNRTVKCIFCDTERILNPDQYQTYFDYWGTEERVDKNFFCKPCDVKMQDNPIKFWFLNGDDLKTLSKNLKACFDLYTRSPRAQNDLLSLQSMSTAFLNAAKIDGSNFEFIVSNAVPVAMKIKNIPFVGDLQLNVYENRILEL